MGVENTSDPEVSSDEAGPETVLDSDDRESFETVSPVDLTSRRGDDLRLLEAILFAATEHLELQTLRDRLPDRSDVPILLQELQEKCTIDEEMIVRFGLDKPLDYPDIHKYRLSQKPGRKKRKKSDKSA